MNDTMMKHYFCCLLAFLLIGKIHAQQKHTLSGYIADERSGEKLISVRIYDLNSKQGVLTNNFGFYSLTLEEGPVELVVAYAGYESLKKSFTLTEATTLNISLEQYAVDEVEIVAENQERIEERTEMSTVEIPISQVKKLPALLGEVDVIKAIQLLPGVQSGSEGSTGLYVRGGGPDQNLILLDDVPLYYVSHLGGFFSVFNADAINSVKLTKGGFPARFGGRLSSVLDIRMKEGNMKDFQVEGSLGLISSKISVQGPIVKDKTSFIISARRTYLDLLTRPISKAATNGEGSFGYHFYDLNAKINHTFSDKDRLYFSGYLGNDVLGVKAVDSEGIRSDEDYYNFELKNRTIWGNKLAAIRWNHIWNDRLFSNLTATYTKYGFTNRTDILDEYNTQRDGETVLQKFDGRLSYQSGIEDIGGKLDFDFYPSPEHVIRFGVNVTHHSFTPGLLGLKFSDEFIRTDTTLNQQKAESLESAIYIEDEFKVGRRFSANVGVRGVRYDVNKKTYYSIEPRFSARYLMGDRWAVKASYVNMTQYLHLLSNSGAGLPIDLWVPATDRVAPQRAWQAAIGLATSFKDGAYEFSIEGYYKDMQNLIEYKEGTSFFLGFEDGDWQDKVATGGHGESYGAELLLQKKQGKTTGWLGYTLSWNNRQFDELNGGRTYPYKYDRRHDLSLVLIHQLSDNISISGTWVFGTGNAITLPSGTYRTVVEPYTGLPQPNIGSYASLLNGGGYYYRGGNEVSLFENGRNGFRMQAYHRMDFGINFSKKTKWGERTWNVSIYNVYNRLNPYTYVLRRSFEPAEGTDTLKLKKLALFPIIPSVSYSFKF